MQQKISINMKRQLYLFLTVIALAWSESATAFDVCVDGIYYDLNGKEATVTNNAEPKCYVGKVVIPSEIKYNNVRYRVTAIAPEAFKGCTGLTDVSIPASVKTVGDDAFRHCPLLPVHDMLYYADTYLVGPYECSVTGTFKIKEGTRWIGNGAFNEITCIRSINIPASVESIGTGAFRLCDYLNSVTINGKVEIGQDAFAGTKAICEINIYSDDTPTIKDEEKAFDETVYQKALIHVAPGTGNSYRSTYGWRKFSNLTDDLPLSGIGNVTAPADATVKARYNTRGEALSHPVKGINIIKTAGGKTYKTIVR